MRVAVVTLAVAVFCADASVRSRKQSHGPCNGETFGFNISVNNSHAFIAECAIAALGQLNESISCERHRLVEPHPIGRFHRDQLCANVHRRAIDLTTFTGAAVARKARSSGSGRAFVWRRQCDMVWYTSDRVMASAGDRVR